MMVRMALWAVGLGVWGLFTFWYTNTSGPLTAEEIDGYVGRFDAASGDGSPERLRAFLESDTGNQFIMVNLIHLAEDPPDVSGAEPGESSESLLGRYMEFMFPALLARACHPVYAGDAVAAALDLVGLPDADQWTRGALMRYRSRRDLLEIATNPEFAGRHDFKIAALEKTIAFPVENTLYYSDARFMLALILFSICSLIDLVVWRRKLA